MHRCGNDVSTALLCLFYSARFIVMARKLELACGSAVIFLLFLLSLLFGHLTGQSRGMCAPWPHPRSLRTHCQSPAGAILSPTKSGEVSGRGPFRLTPFAFHCHIDRLVTR